MEIYLVGGAVRDELLGRAVVERDWVVVGATPQQLLDQGYKPVGKDFPVFLHPQTHEEYALARTERKIGPGYKGFSVYAAPNITLEEDLLRRDLTINAIARAQDGRLIDPFHGVQDLQARLLRHISPAFAEDPVRILRVARFAARYAHLGFSVAKETLELMRAMVAAGEVEALVAERVWQEWQRALTEDSPAVFFEVLNQVGALGILFPSLLPDHERHQILLHRVAELTQDPLIRFATHVQAAAPALDKIYRIPRDYRALADLVARHKETCHQVLQLSAEDLCQLLTVLDAYRRPERFEQFLLACAADYCVKSEEVIYPQAQRLKAVFDIARTVSVQPLLEAGFTGPALAKELLVHRIKAVHKSNSNFLRT